MWSTLKEFFKSNDTQLLESCDWKPKQTFHIPVSLCSISVIRSPDRDPENNYRLEPSRSSASLSLSPPSCRRLRAFDFPELRSGSRSSLHFLRFNFKTGNSSLKNGGGGGGGGTHRGGEHEWEAERSK